MAADIIYFGDAAIALPEPLESEHYTVGPDQYDPNTDDHVARMENIARAMVGIAAWDKKRMDLDYAHGNEILLSVSTNILRDAIRLALFEEFSPEEWISAQLTGSTKHLLVGEARTKDLIIHGNCIRDIGLKVIRKRSGRFIEVSDVTTSLCKQLLRCRRYNDVPGMLWERTPSSWEKTPPKQE